MTDHDRADMPIKTILVWQFLQHVDGLCDVNDGRGLSRRLLNFAARVRRPLKGRAPFRAHDRIVPAATLTKACAHLVSVVIAVLGLSVSSYAQVPVAAPDAPDGDVFIALAPAAQRSGSGEAMMRERWVRVNRELLEATRANVGRARTRPVLRLNLFDDTGIDVTVDRTGQTSAGYWLRGHLAGDRLSDVTLVVNGDVIMGTVRVPDATYEIRPVGDGVYAIRQLDPAALGSTDGVILEPPSVPAPSDSRSMPATRRSAAVDNAVGGGTADAEDGSSIDLLVVYTPDARVAQGGHNEIKTLIDLFVVETNEALADSGAIPRFNLVHTQQVEYTQQPLSSDDDESVIMRHLLDPADGYMDEAHAIRDRYGADLVQLIVTEVGFPYCGEAKRLQPSDDRAAERYAFGVSRYDCGSTVLAHELGHAMGLNHDRYAERHACCIVRHNREWNKPHPYSYGYVNQRAFEPGAPESSHWVTVMSYGTQCEDAGLRCRHLMRFSNPDLSRAGDPMGVPGAEPSSEVNGPSDARRTLNELAHVVANFRASVNRPPIPLGVLSPLVIRVDGAAAAVNLAPAFRDPDGDVLTYGATSSAPRVASVAVARNVAAVTPVATGTATVQVTATDPDGLSATQSFTVTVSPPANRPPVALGTLRRLTIGIDDPPRVVDMTSAFRDPDGDPLTYGATSTPQRVVSLAVSGHAITATPVAIGTATVQVTATDPGGLGATQSFIVRVIAPFTDHPIQPGVTPVRAVHFTELRTRIDVLRDEAALQRFNWTDSVLRPGVTTVRLTHLLELRQALTQAYVAWARQPPRWTDLPASGTNAIRALHLMELRAAVMALE